MNDVSAPAMESAPIDDIMRRELLHGDAQIASITPILRHLLANDEHSVFGDEIIARVRGMLTNLAEQLLDALAKAKGSAFYGQPENDQIEALVQSMASQNGFLAHAHALALEWQLTERLQSRLGLDPVVSPLLQALIASSDPQVAASAMVLLAQNARFAQSQRRMQLPLGELPGDLLHTALLALRNLDADPAHQSACAAADQAVRGDFDESRSRQGLIARLVTGMGGGASAALSVTHAGVGIFLSALAMASGQNRDLMVLSTNEAQVARLALASCAAGLKPQSVEELFLALHPQIELPDGFHSMGADRAAALLAQSSAFAAG